MSRPNPSSADDPMAEADRQVQAAQDAAAAKVEALLGPGPAKRERVSQPYTLGPNCLEIPDG